MQSTYRWATWRQYRSLDPPRAAHCRACDRRFPMGYQVGALDLICFCLQPLHRTASGISHFPIQVLEVMYRLMDEYRVLVDLGISLQLAAINNYHARPVDSSFSPSVKQTEPMAVLLDQPNPVFHSFGGGVITESSSFPNEPM